MQAVQLRTLNIPNLYISIYIYIYNIDLVLKLNFFKRNVKVTHEMS